MLAPVRRAGEVLKVLDRDSARLIALKRIPLTQHSRETVSAMAEEVRRRQARMAALVLSRRVRSGPRRPSAYGCAVWCAQATTLAQLSHENVLKCFGHR